MNFWRTPQSDRVVTHASHGLLSAMRGETPYGALERYPDLKRGDLKRGDPYLKSRAFDLEHHVPACGATWGDSTTALLVWAMQGWTVAGTSRDGTAQVGEIDCPHCQMLVQQARGPDWDYFIEVWLPGQVACAKAFDDNRVSFVSRVHDETTFQAPEGMTFAEAVKSLRSGGVWITNNMVNLIIPRTQWPDGTSAPYIWPHE